MVRNTGGSSIFSRGRKGACPLGLYPETTLAEARNLAIKERRKLKDGIDSATARRAGKQAKWEKNANTFEAVGRRMVQEKARDMGTGYSPQS